MKGGIAEHTFSGESGKAVDAPRVLIGFQPFQKSVVGRNTIAEPQPGGSEKLRRTANDEQIIELLHERDGADFRQDIGKFNVCFIYHDRCADFFAVRKDLAHFAGAYRRTGGIVWVAGDKDADFRRKGVQERVQIQAETVLLFQREISETAAGKGDFALIFGVRRTEDYGMRSMHSLYECGNQLCRAVADNDMFRRRAGIPSDGFAQCGVAFIGVCGNNA